MWSAWIHRAKATTAGPSVERETRQPRKRPKKLRGIRLREALRLAERRLAYKNNPLHGVRIKVLDGEFCAVCEKAKLRMTLHHLKPRAMMEPGEKGDTVTLCRACHDYAHDAYGPGDDYDGPFERAEFVAAMRAMMDLERASSWK